MKIHNNNNNYTAKLSLKNINFRSEILNESSILMVCLDCTRYSGYSICWDIVNNDY